MNRYEYEGEDVVAVGINDIGAYFIETTDGRYTWPNMKLTGGMMTISVEEVCAKYDVFHPGQVVYGPRRGE